MVSNPQVVTVEDAGRLVARATVYADKHQILYAQLHVEAGHLPVGTRTRLVDAVLDQAAVRRAARFTVTLPAGDGEILDRLRQRCRQVETRTAGASCLALCVGLGR